jgi:Flp pilus assembly protein TadG
MNYNKQSGVAIVEFALVLPLLLLLTFITTEFGRALYQYNTLTKSVRDAARYLSTQSPGDTTKYSIAKNLAVYGNPAGSGTPLAIGLSTAQVADPVWQLKGASPVINTVTITIGYGAVGDNTRYKFVPLVASVFGVILGNGNTGIPFAPISATMRAPL